MYARATHLHARMCCQESATSPPTTKTTTLIQKMRECANLFSSFQIQKICTALQTFSSRYFATNSTNIARFSEFCSVPQVSLHFFSSELVPRWIRISTAFCLVQCSTDLIWFVWMKLFKTGRFVRTLAGKSVHGTGTSLTHHTMSTLAGGFQDGTGALLANHFMI